MTPDTKAAPWQRLALWGPAAAVFLLHAIFATTYGIFRDELYYLACAARLDWGYVDHPPLIAAITALWTAVCGDSLRAIRLLAAFAGAATVAASGSLARRMGGGNWAVALTGLAVGLSPIVLGLTSVLSMNVFDLLFWALACRIVAALLDGGGERLWLAFGAVAGLGLLNKISMLFLGFGLAVGIVAARRFDLLRSRYLWFAGALAGLLFAPHLAWQHLHGWPTREFMANASQTKNVALAPLDFLARQVLQTGPLHALVWIAGLAALLFAAQLRPWRPFGVAYLTILAVMLSTAAKPYYLAPAYPMLWAAGAVAIEAWTRSRRGGQLLRAAAVGAVVLSGLAFAPLARAILPVDAYVRYARALGQEPGTDERKSLGRLPQFFADMQEWRGLAESVAVATARLTPDERRGACVFGQNYGEASAVDYFGRELSLPPAISGHNSWHLWGMGACSGEVLLVVGDDEPSLRKLFAEVELGATFDCRDCMPYEDDLPVWIVRRPRVDVAALWPRIRHFD